MKSLITVAACCSTFLFLTCSNPSAGNGSDVGNPFISGNLVNKDGTPAANAVVRFIPVSQMPIPGLSKTTGGEYSCVTDKDGHYGFDSLPDTLYNVFGERNGDMCFHDSVHIIKHDSTRISTDTLKAPGSLSGIVRLQPEQSSSTVLLLLPGTSTFIIPSDSIGHFTIARMARGTYPVHIITTIDEYTPKDTVFTIRSGMSDTLPDTMRLRYTGVPVVRGVKAVLDSLRISVTVSWNRADSALVAGYNVYRGNIDSTFGTVPINGVLVQDTFFTDENLIQRQGQTMVYKVKAVNSNSDMSKTLSAGAQVTIASAYYLADTLLLPSNAFNSIKTNINGDLFLWDEGNTLGSDSTFIVYKIAYGSKTPVCLTLQDSMHRYDSYMYAFPYFDDSNYCYVLIIERYVGNIALNKYTSDGIFVSKLDISSIPFLSSSIASSRGLYVWNNRINAVIENGVETHVKIYSNTGDSIFSWMLSPSYLPQDNIDYYVLNDSVLFAKKSSEHKLIFFDMSTGLQNYDATQSIMFPPDFSFLFMYSSYNRLLIWNYEQVRLYQISNAGQIDKCVELDPVICIMAAGVNDFAVGKDGEFYCFLNTITVSKIGVYRSR